MGRVRSVLAGLRQFLMRGNVVDLAVAVVIGTAFTAVVTSLMQNIFTPLIAAAFGEPDFAGLTFTINDSTFRYGEFINSVIAFLSVAVVIYFVVVMPLAELAELRNRGQVAPEEDAGPSEEARLLTEIVTCSPLGNLTGDGPRPSRPAVRRRSGRRHPGDRGGCGPRDPRTLGLTGAGVAHRLGSPAARAVGCLDTVSKSGSC
jgi:large conductance mechanosensitive channel